MDELYGLIRSDKLIEAEELFLNNADMLFGLGEYDKLHKLAECFPEKYRRNRMLLEFFFHSSIHFVSPYAAREKLFELIPLFEIEKNYDRIADIYIILLINYTYHCEESVEPLRLSDVAETFIKKNKNSANKIVKLSMWIQITRIWYRSGEIRIQDVGYEIERIAFELKDSFALIVVRVFQADNYNRNGKFKSALQEFDKAERIVRNQKENVIFGPFVSFWKCDTYFQMRLFGDLKKEVEKGLALVDEQSIFCDYLKPYLFLYHVFMQNYEACEEIKESVLFGKLSKNEFFRNHFLYLGEMLLSYFAGQKEKVVYYCSKIIPIKGTEFYFYVWPLSRINFAEFNLYAGNYDIVQKILNHVLKVRPEEEHTNLTLGVHALLSIMYDRINDRKKVEIHLKKMGKIIDEAKPEEVPILNNTLLQEIAEKSKNTALQKLLRKRTINETIDYPVSSEAVENSVRSDNHNVEIRAFGELRFFVDGKKISSSDMERQKLILKIIKLLITNYDKGVSRDVCYNIFWKGYDEKSARYNLNSNLYKIRKIFGKKFVTVDGNNVRLNQDSFWLDVAAFDNNIRMGKKAMRDGLIRQAIKCFQDAEDLYTGDYIENDLYNDFITAKKASLQNKQLNLLFNSMKMSLDENDFFKALEKGKKLVRQSPCCEPAYRLLMIACALSGDHSSLKSLYNKLNQLLKLKLNIEADQKTRDLLEVLLHDEVPTSSLWEKEQLI